MKIFNWLAPLFFAVALTYCTQRSSTTGMAQGGQDGGGGQIHVSTVEQVRAAIDDAIRLANEPDINRNIFVRFYMEWVFIGQMVDVEKAPEVQIFHEDMAQLYFKIFMPQHLFPFLSPNRDLLGFEDIKVPKTKELLENEWSETMNRLVGRVYIPPEFDGNATMFRSPPLAALRTNRIGYKLKGDCAEPERKHADAAVSNFTTHADICFSLGNLTRIPPALLLQEILGLVLHEASHMGGANEAEAQLWQRQFLLYFSARFGSINVTLFKERVERAIDIATEYIRGAAHLQEASPGHRRVWVLGGQFLSSLIHIPSYLDPLMLELTLKPTHPELFNNYANSVLSLVQRANTLFHSDGPVYDRDKVELPKLSDAELKIEIESLEKMAFAVADNFRAYINPDNLLYIKCVLPAQPIDPYDYDRYLGVHHGFEPGRQNNSTVQLRPRLILPPRACDVPKVLAGETPPKP